MSTTNINNRHLNEFLVRISHNSYSFAVADIEPNPKCITVFLERGFRGLEIDVCRANKKTRKLPSRCMVAHKKYIRKRSKKISLEAFLYRIQAWRMKTDNAEHFPIFLFLEIMVDNIRRWRFWTRKRRDKERGEFVKTVLGVVLNELSNSYTPWSEHFVSYGACKKSAIANPTGNPWPMLCECRGKVVLLTNQCKYLSKKYLPEDMRAFVFCVDDKQFFANFASGTEQQLRNRICRLNIEPYTILRAVPATFHRVRPLEVAFGSLTLVDVEVCSRLGIQLAAVDYPNDWFCNRVFGNADHKHRSEPVIGQ